MLCAAMDARCSQVYNALFQVEKGSLHRLTEDRALSIAELETQCRSYGERLLLLGDGAALCHKTFSKWGARLAPENMRFQHAASVALLGERSVREGQAVPAAVLAPVYLRLPQAERELKKRLGQKA